MRTGFLYGGFLSVGILLGVFNDNIFWMIAVPTLLTFLAVITVVHGERLRSEELRNAQERTIKVLNQQRAYSKDKFDIL